MAKWRAGTVPLSKSEAEIVNPLSRIIATASSVVAFWSRIQAMNTASDIGRFPSAVSGVA